PARLQEAPLPGVPAAGHEDAGAVPARVVRRGPARAVRRGSAAGSAGPPGARAGHHLPDGLRQLLPDRLGLRALRDRTRHPRQRPRLGLPRLGELRPQAPLRPPPPVRPPLPPPPLPPPQPPPPPPPHPFPPPA